MIGPALPNKQICQEGITHKVNELEGQDGTMELVNPIVELATQTLSCRVKSAPKKLGSNSDLRRPCQAHKPKHQSSKREKHLTQEAEIM